MAWPSYAGGQPPAFPPYHFPGAAPSYESAYPWQAGYPLWPQCVFPYPVNYPNVPSSYHAVPSGESSGASAHWHHLSPSPSSSANSASPPQTSSVKLPEKILSEVRAIMKMTKRIEDIYLDALDAPLKVIDAAYDQVLAEEEKKEAEEDERLWPEGAVLQCDDDTTFRTRYTWPLAHRLPKHHHWNLDSLWKAASTIYDIRGLDRSNRPSPREEYRHLWGFDVNRLALPTIIPHPNPPMPTHRGRLAAKHHEREMEAFKWVFSLPQHRDYGYGHLYALQIHGIVLYDIIKELSKAVALRNLVMDLTGAYDVQQALRMAERERRAGESRVRFVLGGR